MIWRLTYTCDSEKNQINRTCVIICEISILFLSRRGITPSHGGPTHEVFVNVGSLPRKKRLVLQAKNDI